MSAQVITETVASPDGPIKVHQFYCTPCATGSDLTPDLVGKTRAESLAAEHDTAFHGGYNLEGEDA